MYKETRTRNTQTQYSNIINSAHLYIYLKPMYKYATFMILIFLLY